MKKFLYTVGGLTLILFVGALVNAGSYDPGVQAPTGSAPQTASISDAVAEVSYAVTRVVDGDTLKIDKEGEEVTVRLIGVDTPESVDPRKPVQCYALAASDRTKQLMQGARITLEFDDSQGEQDKYGRVLAYVRRTDGTFLNEALIREGFAYEYTYNDAYKYQVAFKAAEQEAREQKRGLWADDACEKPTMPSQVQTKDQPTNSPPPAGVSPRPVPKAAEVKSSGGNCSSNTYNCSNFKTHAEAQALYESCGGVGNDIHQLDGDDDGSACETLP